MFFDSHYDDRVIFYQDDVMASAFLKACLGVACVMYWFALIQYLEFFPRYAASNFQAVYRFVSFINHVSVYSYYVMISMLKLSAPRVSKFLLGVLPIFIGNVSRSS